jgi:hypothetical protein
VAVVTGIPKGAVSFAGTASAYRPIAAKRIAATSSTTGRITTSTFVY